MKRTIAIIILTAVITAGLTLGGVLMYMRHFEGGLPGNNARDSQTTSDGENMPGMLSWYGPDTRGNDAEIITDWWIPVSEEERSFCGIWYSEDGECALVLNDNAAFVAFSSPVTMADGKTVYGSSQDGVWWLGEGLSTINFAEERRLEYADGEVTEFSVAEMTGEKLVLAIGRDRVVLYSSDSEERPSLYSELPEYNDAKVVFTLTSPAAVSASALNEAGKLSVTARMEIVEGSLAWWGSSTDYGPGIILTAKDGTPLVEEPLCYTCDYTYNPRTTGSVRTGERTFRASEQPGGRFAPGVYDVTFVYHGATETIEGGFVITE